MELLEPVQRVGDEEVADLAAAEVEDVGAPVALLAAARVGVLVERGAVEAGQRPGVLREVGGDPVDDHADARGVQRVDEVAQLVGGAEAARRRVVGRHLVAPRPAERVLRHRQQLDMGEPQLGDVVDQRGGELAVAQTRLPGREVHLVGAHRPGVGLALRALGQPGGVVPGVVAACQRDHRGRGGWDLGGERHGVGLVDDGTVRSGDAELVAGAQAQSGDEDLPHAGGAEAAHRRRAAGPAVEVADHAHPAGRWCPHRERDPPRPCRRGCRSCAGARRAPPTAARGDPGRTGADRPRRGWAGNRYPSATVWVSPP